MIGFSERDTGSIGDTIETNNYSSDTNVFGGTASTINKARMKALAIVRLILGTGTVKKTAGAQKLWSSQWRF